MTSNKYPPLTVVAIIDGSNRVTANADMSRLLLKHAIMSTPIDSKITAVAGVNILAAAFTEYVMGLSDA